MGDNFDVRLLKRALGARKTDLSIKPLYGDTTWAQDLDIVNELGAHTGCVNALKYCCPLASPYARISLWLTLWQLVHEWQPPGLGLRRYLSQHLVL